MVGSESDDLNNLFIGSAGSLNVLFGDPSYGYPTSSVDAIPSNPIIIDLAQNYPNPFSILHILIFPYLSRNFTGKN